MSTRSFYDKQIFNPYDKTLTLEENILNNGIITAEDMNRHEEGIHAAHEELKNKMDKKFSSEYHGKLLGVDSNGNAVPVKVPGLPILKEDGVLEFDKFQIPELDKNGTLIP